MLNINNTIKIMIKIIKNYFVVKYGKLLLIVLFIINSFIDNCDNYPVSGIVV
jgi:hypothetical protein